MKAIIYTRVSTEEQSQSGLGLEAQESACRTFAGTLGASEVLLFTDAGISGSKGIEDRPALTEALAALRKGDILIVANVTESQEICLLLSRWRKSFLSAARSS